MHQRIFGTPARSDVPRVLASVSATLLAAFVPLSGSAADSQFSAKAVATIESCPNADNPLSGFATLKERASDEGIKQVDVYMQVRGFGEGTNDRAVHIHETAACTPCGQEEEGSGDFTDANGHFDPGPDGNPVPDDNHPYHLGDLINLEVRGELGTMKTRTSRITLSEGPLSVFDPDGSAFIVHVAEDTYCPDEDKEAGCAGGARAACGIIRRVDTADDFELLVSTSSKREDATELSGAQLSDKAYVFVGPAFPRSPVASVDFFVNGRQVTRQVAAPYDLIGSNGSDKAASIDTRRFPDGTYIVAAIINLADGEQTYLSSEFTVDNDKKRFLNGSENH